MTTLAERLGPVAPPVAAPHRDVEWRAAAPADVDELVELHGAIARADHPHWTMHRDELAEAFTLSHVDPARDTLVGVGREGRLIAHGLVMCPPGRETMVRSIVLGAVHPECRRRGIGPGPAGPLRYHVGRSCLARSRDAGPPFPAARLRAAPGDAGGRHAAGRSSRARPR